MQRRKQGKALLPQPAAEALAGGGGGTLEDVLQTPFSARPKGFTEKQCRWGPPPTWCHACTTPEPCPPFIRILPHPSPHRPMLACAAPRRRLL